MMSEDEIKSVIAEVIAETDDISIADMGKIMGALKSKFAGKMDMGSASKLIKDALS